MIPRIAISERCRPGANVNEDYLAFVEAGAGGIGLSERSFADGRDPEALFHFIESGLKATTVEPALATILPVGPGEDPAGPAERIAVIAHSLRRFAVFDPHALVVGSGAAPARASAEEAWELLADGVRQLARTARGLHPRGVPLGIAPGDGDSLVRTPADAARLIDAAGEPGVRIVAVAGAGGEASLAEAIASAARIGCVRISLSLLDAEPGPDGSIGALISGLTAGGYRGWYELTPGSAEEARPAPAELADAVVRLTALHQEAQRIEIPQGAEHV
ncbi:MAG: TIM barrel protein [Actinobacteria bacterium]|nr:TIM barrel protein [Actinomycetota bacterium]